MSKAAGIFLAAVLLAGGLYVWARLHRYEISYGGNQRYYLALKLDRWTGRTWKLNAGPGWTEISPQKSQDAKPEPEEKTSE